MQVEQGGQRRSGRAALLVAAPAAAATIGLYLLTDGLSFWLPMLIGLRLVQNGAIAVLIPNVGVPALVIAVARRPWWVRWAAVGVLVANIGVLGWYAWTAYVLVHR